MWSSRRTCGRHWLPERLPGPRSTRRAGHLRDGDRPRPAGGDLRARRRRSRRRLVGLRGPAAPDPAGDGVRRVPAGVAHVGAAALRRDAPGLLRPRRPPGRHGPQPDRAIAVLPDVPAVRGPGRSSRPRTRTSRLACVRAFNDWMIEEWCGDSGGRLIPLCLVPLWDPTAAAAEVRRNAARGCRAIAFTELPANLGLPSIHDADRFWDPLLAACDDTGDHDLHAHRLGFEDADDQPDAPAGGRHRPHVAERLHVDGRLAAVGCARPVPAAQDRVLGEPGRLDAVPHGAPRPGVHEQRGVVAARPVDHRPAVELRARPGVRLLLRRHGRRRCPPPDRHRAAGVRDRLPAPGHHLAAHDGAGRRDRRAGAGRRARDAGAHQRDHDARPRSGRSARLHAADASAAGAP